MVINGSVMSFYNQKYLISPQVVPLSQRSGVLEWCTGTIPIGEYLVNNEEGAHKRYRPNDFSASQCQKKMMVS